MVCQDSFQGKSTKNIQRQRAAFIIKITNYVKVFFHGLKIFFHLVDAQTEKRVNIENNELNRLCGLSRTQEV